LQNSFRAYQSHRQSKCADWVRGVRGYAPLELGAGTLRPVSFRAGACNTKLRSDERNLVLGGRNRRPQNEAEICKQPKSCGKIAISQSPTGRPWYPMRIGYQDVFETTGFPSFSKTLTYSVQCQLDAIWYKPFRMLTGDSAVAASLTNRLLLISNPIANVMNAKRKAVCSKGFHLATCTLEFGTDITWNSKLALKE
jgi:hypothetical protein